MDGSLFPLLLLVMLAAAFWVLVIRPARTRQQEQARVVAALVPGARVLMASGMVGSVVAVHDDDLEIEIAPGVVATFVRQAVLREVPDEPSSTATGAPATAAPTTGTPDAGTDVTDTDGTDTDGTDTDGTDRTD